MANFGWFTKYSIGCDWSCHRARGSLGGEDRRHPLGSAVLAPYDGTVTYGMYGDGSSYAQVKYSNGYAHQAIHVQSGGRVANGSRVSEGTRIALSGGAPGTYGAGLSSGPHVHFQGMDPQGRRIPWRDVPAPYSGQPAGGGEPVDLKVLREQQFLNAAFNAGLDEDGNYGPATKQAYINYQVFLRDNGYGYLDAIDGIWGPNMQTAHAKYYAVWERDRLIRFPLAAGQYFGPEAGGPNSISGWHSHNEDLKRWQQRMKDRGWSITVDGLYGPKGATTPQGETASVAMAFQKEKGYTVDGLIGPQTWDGAWKEPITPAPGTEPQPEPEPEPEPQPQPQPGKMVTPTAADFPAWIRYEEKFDQQWLAGRDGWNDRWKKYYDDKYGGDNTYRPIESHTHWWNEPGKGGTHDGNVNYLNATEYVGANYVTSAKRITLTMPLDQIALTTGSANPVAWKSENDPMITVEGGDEWGYKTLGFLHYIVEVKNPHLRNELIWLHKEKLPGTTSCSNIDKAKVRAYAEAFHTGKLDPATGLPPATPQPEPEEPAEPQVPEGKVLVDRAFLENLRDNEIANAEEIWKVLG